MSHSDRMHAHATYIRVCAAALRGGDEAAQKQAAALDAEAARIDVVAGPAPDEREEDYQ